MRIFITVFFLLYSTLAFSVVRGINYDPAHSSVYTDAQGAQKLEQMKKEVNIDLEAIKKSGFTHIKTFYSSYGFGGEK